MTNEIDEHHAKTLIGVVEHSGLWKLHPEKRSPFKNSEEALRYVESHNEPLCIRVPIAGSDDHLTVKVTSSGEDVIFTTSSFDDVVEERVHSSHLKLVESTVSNMLNSRLPEGTKVASF